MQNATIQDTDTDTDTDTDNRTQQLTEPHDAGTLTASEPGSTDTSNPTITILPDDLGNMNFEQLDGIVRKGSMAFVEVGRALAVIKKRELWKEGGFQNWREYGDSRLGQSGNYAEPPNWEKFKGMLRVFPLTPARIVHSRM